MRALLFIPLLFGCGLLDEDTVCADFNAEMKACLGDQFSPVECDQISRTDLVNLTDLARDLDCEENGWALPIDGDYLSSSCRLTGVGCVAAVNPPPVFSPAAYPILLVNGIDVSPLFGYDERILYVMREFGGHDVHLAVDTPYETPQRRARDLWRHVQRIREETGSPKVNLICHSLGGLDCRYLVSPNGLHWEVPAAHEEIAGAVASITTVSTAHHGTHVADVALGFTPDGDDFEAAERLATSLGDAFTAEDIQEDVQLRAAIQALTTSSMRAFNETIVDADGIYYQSYAGFSAPYGVPAPGQDELLRELCETEEVGLHYFLGHHDHMATTLIPSSEIVADDGSGRSLPNDGLAPVGSARWGRFRGCIPADHMEQLGQYRLPAVNVRTGFDVARFYAEIASELAERGY